MAKGGEKSFPWWRLFICLLIIGGAVIGFIFLNNLKKPPVAKEIKKAVLPVQVITVQPQTYQVMLHGFGDIIAREKTMLSAEVSGRISFMHNNLEAGWIVDKGAVLFKIDDRDHLIDLTTARTREAILSRDLEIGEAGLKRISDLYKNKRVGSLSQLEKAESSLNSIEDQLQQVRQTGKRAEVKLDRSIIKAPFAGRVGTVTARPGEFVTPGKSLITLINDQSLEIIISLDGRDASRWLLFNEESRNTNTKAVPNWFPPLQPVNPVITWSEDREVHGYGVLDRITRYDPKTRSFQVAVSLNKSLHSSIPLVEGMFVEVTIPGRILDNVFVVPRHTVNFTGTVFIVENNRLLRRKVEVIHHGDGTAIINDGLKAGDKVITTRLETPLENSLVRIIGKNQP
jgi:RND family efflux transporter MFP subunit